MQVASQFNHELFLVRFSFVWFIPGLWGVINNAGVSGNAGPVEWMEISDYRECLSVNLFGVIDTTVTFLPLVKKAKGRIVNVASIAGRTSLGGVTPYSVSKYGVEAFSDALR